MRSDRAFEEIRFTARDGLSLYARRYPAPGSYRRPVLCLAGLTRNSRDFHDIAVALSSPGNSAPREVYAVDARGRGQSDHDPDWRNYSVPVEMHDALDFMTAAALNQPAIIGTSRGGLIAMLMGGAQPSRLGPVVLNDIGPVIDTRGLSRIAGYVGKMPLPQTWAEAERMVRDMNRKPFPAVADEAWAEVARALFNEKGGKPAPGYDPKLGRAFTAIGGPIPALWPQFESLGHVPVMVLRGSRSDLLSVATVEEMARRHANLTALTIEGQGHAPLLKDAPSISAIAAFIARYDEY
jgi:pimeloyl-ACP methyl ester carboxylesterase